MSGRSSSGWGGLRAALFVLGLASCAGVDSHKDRSVLYEAGECAREVELVIEYCGHPPVECPRFERRDECDELEGR